MDINFITLEIFNLKVLKVGRIWFNKLQKLLLTVKLVEMLPLSQKLMLPLVLLMHLLMQDVQ